MNSRGARKLRLTQSLGWLGQRAGVFSSMTMRVGRAVSGPHAWIVTFHDVCTAGDELTYGVDVQTFEQTLRHFNEHFDVVPLSSILELAAARFSGAKSRFGMAGRPFLAVTFDDGRKSLVTNALPVLKKHGICATAFIISKTLDPEFLVWTDVVEWLVKQLDRVTLPKYLGYAVSIDTGDFLRKRDAVITLKSFLRYMPARRRQMALRDLFLVNGLGTETLCPGGLYLSGDDLRTLVESGIEIGSHSHTHEVFSLLSVEEARGELITSKRVLEEAAGTPVRYFAFPNGTAADFRPQDVALAREAGFEAVLTTVRGAVSLTPGQFLLPRIEAPGGYEEQPLNLFSCLLAFESMMARVKQRRLRSLTRQRKTINVLYVIDYLHPDYAGGTETQLEGTLRNVDREFVNPFLCVLRGEAPKEFACPVTVLGVDKLLAPGSLKGLFSLVRLMRRERIDAAHLFFFDSVVLGTIAAALSRVPVRISARRGLRSLTVRPSQMFLVRLLDRVTTCVLSNSFAVRDCVLEDEGIPRAKALVLHNGMFVPESTALSPGEAKLKLGLRPNDVCIGLVANLRHVKGVDVFLGAAALVHETEPSARFSVFGEGELRDSLTALAAELGLGDAVTFHGFNRSAYELVPGFDVAVVSSRSEGCSNALLEYCFAGSAIAATDVGGNAEIISNCESGLLVPSERPALLAEAILKLAGDSHLRTWIGSQARNDANAKFLMRDALRQLCCLYWRLLHPQGAPYLRTG
jgi:peptidoglycan/xylan/chitin deacetylase (PgdA/CDA1 family)